MTDAFASLLFLFLQAVSFVWSLVTEHTIAIVLVFQILVFLSINEVNKNTSRMNARMKEIERKLSGGETASIDDWEDDEM
jgi:low affinity Fe/Cu permease